MFRCFSKNNITIIPFYPLYKINLFYLIRFSYQLPILLKADALSKIRMSKFYVACDPNGHLPFLFFLILASRHALLLALGGLKAVKGRVVGLRPLGPQS
jgi:hypothetical protein